MRADFRYYHRVLSLEELEKMIKEEKIIEAKNFNLKKHTWKVFGDIY